MLQFYLIFSLLVLEGFALLGLLFPVPSFLVTANLALLHKIRHVLRFTLAVLLFFTIEATLDMRKEESRDAVYSDLPSELQSKTKKFRAERNFYLCMFTLTLLVVLLRLETIVRNTKQLTKELAEAKVGFVAKNE